MSAFYDLASLVLVPSGYKTSKVYAQKPLTTDGQLTFSRSTNATRVGPNGLIEKVRTNLAIQSQNFSSGSWLVLNSTKVSTANTDPNGGNTACNVTWGAGTSAYLYGSVAQTGYYTISMWVKSNGGGNNFRLFGDGTASNSADFTATTSWQRFSFTLNASGGSSWGIRNNSTQDAADLLVAFAQLEVSDFGATDYIATTSAAVSVGPVANVPRLDYLGSSCPRLLLEPQRTNVVDWSEDFSKWLGSLSVTTNFATSPDGYQNADKLTSSLSTDTKYRSFGGNANCTASIFAKKVDSDYILISYGSPSSIYAIFRLTDGVCTAATSGITTTSQDYGNGWWRFSIATTTQSAGYIELCPNASPTVRDSSGSCLVWGAQYESLVSYATSYIPTFGAAVTRLADACSKTGISSLIGQTEGTIFAEFTYNGVANSGNYERIIALGDGTTSNRIILIKNNTSSQLYAFIGDNGASIINQVISGTDIRGTHKAAFAYKTNDFAVYLDGTQIYSNTSGTVPATSNLYVGVNEITGTDIQLAGGISQALVFKTRLTNAQLAELTTL